MRMKMKCKRERCGMRAARRGFLGNPLKILVLAVVCVLAVSALSFAGKRKPKVPRVMMGVVVDGSDSPIVGAVVEMTDVQTGKKSAMYTQEGGHYQFSGLDQDNDYKVQATYRGVASEVRTLSSFDTRNTVRLNLQIPPPKEDSDQHTQ
jgi:Carboxypeptidase regulatory-like domain